MIRLILEEVVDELVDEEQYLVLFNGESDDDPECHLCILNDESWLLPDGSTQDVESAITVFQDPLEGIIEDGDYAPEIGEIEDSVVEDGYGGAWSIWCPDCKKKGIVVIGPGVVECLFCGWSV